MPSTPPRVKSQSASEREALSKRLRTAAPSFIKKSAPSESSLEKIRDKLREARNTVRQIYDAEETVKTLKKDYVTLRHETLPNMFMEAGIDQLGLPPEGNMPGYDCNLGAYYHANIAADWPADKRKEAFDFIDKRGDGDLIKTEITILIPRDERKKAKKVESALKKLKVNYTVDLSIPWSTLTAYVKEQIEKHDAILPLDTLGAQVGSVVKLTQRKT